MYEGVVCKSAVGTRILANRLRKESRAGRSRRSGGTSTFIFAPGGTRRQIPDVGPSGGISIRIAPFEKMGRFAAERALVHSNQS
jgi:hypothetical protein